MGKLFEDDERGYVFVYGTLKQHGNFATRFNSNRLSVKPARIKGKMYKVNNAYPAVILEGKKDVFGELHEYSDFKNVLKELDRIENYDDNPETDLYTRVRMNVWSQNSASYIEAWVYLWNGSVTMLDEMPGGFWPVR